MVITFPHAFLSASSMVRMATTPGTHLSGVRSAMPTIQSSKFHDIQNQVANETATSAISSSPACEP